MMVIQYSNLIAGFTEFLRAGAFILLSQHRMVYYMRRNLLAINKVTAWANRERTFGARLTYDYGSCSNRSIMHIFLIMVEP